MQLTDNDLPQDEQEIARALTREEQRRIENNAMMRTLIQARQIMAGGREPPERRQEDRPR